MKSKTDKLFSRINYFILVSMNWSYFPPIFLLTESTLSNLVVSNTCGNRKLSSLDLKTYLSMMIPV